MEHQCDGSGHAAGTAEPAAGADIQQHEKSNQKPGRERDIERDKAPDPAVQKIIQASEKYDVKGDIMHPLFQQKVDPYSEIFEETSILQSKGFSGTNNLNLPN